MRRNIQFVALFLIATPIFGQHATGFRSGSMTGSRSGTGRSRPSTIVSAHGSHYHGIFAPGFNRRLGHFGTYSPYLWAYPYFADYGFSGSYDFDYAPFAEDRWPNSIIMDSNAPPAQPATPAHAVINEYKWNETAGNGNSEPATFTIALRDGSRRYPVAVWIQNSNLYYVDSEGHKQTVPSASIDRDATQRLNRENHVNLQLPPS